MYCLSDFKLKEMDKYTVNLRLVILQEDKVEPHQQDLTSLKIVIQETIKVYFCDYFS